MTHYTDKKRNIHPVKYESKIRLAKSKISRISQGKQGRQHNRGNTTAISIGVVALVFVFLFLYLFTGVFGETRIGLTLRSNPDLEDGLVAHYTFDAGTVSGFTVSDTAGSNDGSIVATSTESEAVADISGESNGNHHISSSPQAVWVSEDEGYVFYSDNSPDQIALARSTDGGVSWTGSIPIDTQTDVYRVAVWYDRWTPGDNSGNIIHVLTFDGGDDSLWYVEYDTSNHLASTPIIASPDFVDGIDALNYHSITKAEDGTLFVTIAETGGNYVSMCPSNCTDASNWSEVTGAYTDGSGEDYPVLLPIKDTDNIMLIYQDVSANTIDYDVYSATSSSWWGENTIVSNVEENVGIVEGGNIGATLNRQTGDIYLAYGDDINNYTTEEHKIDVWKFENDTYTWSELTNVGNPFTGGIVAVKIAVDENREGHLYVIYTRRTTIGSILTGNLYYKLSTDDGVTWSGEYGPLNGTEDELDGLGVNIMSSGRISAHWIYETGGVANDIYVVSVADLTEFPEKKMKPGNIGQGIKLDGVDDYVLGSGDSALKPSTNLSFGAWFYSTGPNGSNGNEIMVFDGGSGDGYQLIVDPEDTARTIYCGIRTTGNVYTGNVEPYIQGEWHHGFCTYDGTDLKMYVDGELLDTLNQPGTLSYPAFGSEALQIAKDGSNYFEGIIDDVRVYNRTLSASEVSRLYGLGATTKINKTIDTNPDLKDGLKIHWTFDGDKVDLSTDTSEILDSSGNGVSGNWEEHASTTRPGVLGQGIRFDGINDWIDKSGRECNPLPCSVSIWAKSATSSASAFFRSHDNTQYAGVNIKTEADGKLKVRLGDGTGGSSTDRKDFTTESTPFSDMGLWRHIVVVTESIDVVRMYVDGEYQTYTNDGSATVYSSGTGDEMVVGATRRGGAGDEYWDGELDDFRLYDIALSTSTIKRLYELGATTKINKTLPGSGTLTDGLVGHWTFDGPDTDWGSTTAEIRDVSGNNAHGDATNVAVGDSKIGKIGQALNFAAGGSGSNDVLEIASTTALHDLGPMTYAAWLKIRGCGEGSSGSLLNKAERLRLRMNSSKCTSEYPAMSFYVAYDTNYLSRYAWLKPYNQWQHFVVTWDGSSSGGVSFYLDGVATSSIYSLNGSGSRLTDSGSLLYMGNRNLGTPNNDFYGTMDDVRLYDRVLSQDEVTKLYKMGQ